MGPLFGDCGGTQAEYVLTPDAEHNLLVLPADIPDDDGLLIGDIMSTAWYAATHGGIQDGERILIVGAGPVGFLIAMSAQALGARVFMADIDEERLAFAKLELGVQCVRLDPDNGEQVLPHNVEPFDAAVESVGQTESLILAGNAVRPGGRLIVVGVHSDPTVELPVANWFRRAISVKFCGPSNVQGVWQEVRQAVTEGRLRPSRVVTNHVSYDEVPEAYEAFARREGMKTVIIFKEPSQ